MRVIQGWKRILLDIVLPDLWIGILGGYTMVEDGSISAPRIETLRVKNYRASKRSRAEPRILAELKGPALNLASPQSHLAPAFWNWSGMSC
jgi:hypothetical protein